MESAFHDVHDHEHTEGCANESEEGQVHLDEAATGHGGHQELVVEDLGKLRVGQGEGPETKVRGSVGDGTKNELDGLDHLMDEDLDSVVWALRLDSKTLDHILFEVQTVLRT